MQQPITTTMSLHKMYPTTTTTKTQQHRHRVLVHSSHPPWHPHYISPTLLTQILNCRILLVGFGGIGCELLKNLALSLIAAFHNVEIINLDTIAMLAI